MLVGDDPADLDVCAVRADGSEPPVTVVGGPGRQAEGRYRPRDEASRGEAARGEAARGEAARGEAARAGGRAK